MSIPTRQQGTITHKLTPLDSLSWTSKASRTSYTASGQTPYSDVTSSATWSHTLNQLITLTQTGSFDWYSADDQTNSQRLFWTYTERRASQTHPPFELECVIRRRFFAFIQHRNVCGQLSIRSSSASNGYLANIQTRLPAAQGDEPDADRGAEYVTNYSGRSANKPLSQLRPQPKDQPSLINFNLVAILTNRRQRNEVQPFLRICHICVSIDAPYQRHALLPIPKQIQRCLRQRSSQHCHGCADTRPDAAAVGRTFKPL